MTSPGTELAIGLVCACCNQMYFPDRAFEDAFDAEILGTDQFVVCAVCGLNVPESMRDQDYKRRWRRAMGRHLRQERFRMLIALALLIEMKPNAETDSIFDFVVRRLGAHYPEKRSRS